MSIELPKLSPEITNLSIKLLTTYYSNGQKKAEGNWDGQDPVGDHYSWYKNGNIKDEAIGFDGPIQTTTCWYDNGHMKSKRSYSVEDHFEEIGLWTDYYKNGNKKSEGTYEVEDGRMGEWRFWYQNGELACSGVHKGWEGNGLWSFFESNGKKIHERVYVKSELLEVWKNLSISGCSDELIDQFKQLIFSDEY